MQVYLELPGHAGAARRVGYHYWIEVQALQFERPLLEKDLASFTIHKMLDALSLVLSDHAARGQRIPVVRLHHVEGNQAVKRLRFDEVRVDGIDVDGAADEAMERVRFHAERWQPDP